MLLAFLDQAEYKLNEGMDDVNKVETTGPLIAWLVEHAAAAITRATVGGGSMVTTLTRGCAASGA